MIINKKENEKAFINIHKEAPDIKGPWKLGDPIECIGYRQGPRNSYVDELMRKASIEKNT